MAKILKRQKKGSAKLNALLNKRYKLLSLLIFIIILVFGYFWLLSPRIKDLSEASNVQVPNQQEQLRVLEDYSKEMNKLQSLINSYQATHQTEISKLADVLPTKAMVPELIAQLDSLAQSSGFRLVDLGIVEEELEPQEVSRTRDQEAPSDTSDKSLHSLSINLSLLGGNYFDFKALLANIEKHIRILDLVSISFASSAEAGGYTLVLRTYYFDEAL
ncbi:MAG TPA: hypothetical protein VJK25_00400 [Patescibacteria group bacterium]|nr:hypothetical protein [Patescibacteria group bacterium]